MDVWMTEWLEQKCGGLASDPSRVRLEDGRPLALNGAVSVWHPLADLRAAPQIPFEAPPNIQTVWLGDELAGYVLRSSGEAVTWRELGDASTDTDRFFLVAVGTIEAVIDWFNEELSTFEQLGGDRCVETVERNGTRIVVIQSPDGNAAIRAGYTSAGQVACAVIDV